VTPVTKLDVYEIACLCGGPQRVALAAVVAMQQDGRIKISRTRHRVQIAHRTAGHPVEQAVLAAVPDSGQVPGPVLHDVAHSAALAELIDGLRQHGLVGQHSLTGHPRLSAAGRQARKELEDSGPKVARDRRVAVLGASGIADAVLRDIVQTPDPAPGGRLVAKARKHEKPGPYPGFPADQSISEYPGISGRW
jgi:hypothetical protein